MVLPSAERVEDRSPFALGQSGAPAVACPGDTETTAAATTTTKNGKGRGMRLICASRGPSDSRC